MSDQIATAVKSEAQAGLSWIQRHERILIVALVLGAGSWLGNHYLDNAAAAAKLKADATQQVLAQQVEKNAQLAQQSQAAAAQYQATLSAIAQQNAQLAAAMSNRTIVLQQQQAVDKTLPLPELGQRWSGLLGLAVGSLSANTGGITATPDAARATVAELEQVPVLQANLKDTQKQVQNGQEELSKANVLIGDQQAQVAGLNIEIKDQTKACDARVSSVKADAAKSKRNWFLRGAAVGGAVVGYALLHMI